MSNNPPHLNYRPDIDGLRAVAVGSVVGFHAFPYNFPGGFVGVDVFFVISGFLISTILLSSLEKGSFSIADFYLRRIRRILPALVTMMVACLIGGYFFLLADEFELLGKHVAGGAAFLSNLLYWRESGYFDTAAEKKPMLHLWSLAIEEQFYIVWPLLLALGWKWRRSFVGLIAVLALLSFAGNLYYVRRDPTAAFYSPLLRFWELMLGGALAYLALRRIQCRTEHQHWVSLAGFGLLAAAFLLIDPGTAFPGWWALLPTLGACLVIFAGPNGVINRYLLAHPWMVLIGLISYPLYLWHWPLLSFARIVEGEPARGTTAVLVGISVLLAWLTYRFVEMPVRRSPALWSRSAGLVAGLAACGVTGLLVLQSDGLEGTGIRHSAKTNFSAHFENGLPDWAYHRRERIAEKYRDEACNFYDQERYRRSNGTQVPLATIDPACYTRDSKRERAVLLWGDSHAAHLNYGLQKHLPADWQVLQVTSSGCRPDSRVAADSPDFYCQRSNWFAEQTVRATRPDVVIVAHNWGHDAKDMAQVASDLDSMGAKKVLFLGPTPHWAPDLPKLVVRKLWPETPRRTFVGLDQKVVLQDRDLKMEVEQNEDVGYVSLIDFFCNAEGCLVYTGDDRFNLTSYDYGHLTPGASDLLARERLVPLVTSWQPDS